MGKNYGAKMGAIGKALGEHIGNLMETHWELERNMLGTKETLKKIKSRHLDCMKFLFPKLFVTIFGLG